MVSQVVRLCFGYLFAYLFGYISLTSRKPNLACKHVHKMLLYK